MMFQFLTLKGNGNKYILFNVISILVFTIIYKFVSFYENIDNPWDYWLYYSCITQTTVGYAGLETVRGEKSEISVLTLKSPLFKLSLLLQLLSIILIHGYFIQLS